MSFRLRSNESIAAGLRRLAREELRSISKHLNGATPPQDDAIHEIRKSVKKTRAILQVVKADDGRGLAKSAKRLHAINRRLSAVRDADVMLETLQTLRTKDPRIVNDRCFARVHRRLSSHRKSMMRAARRKGTWTRVRQTVRRIRQDTKQWKPKHRQFGSLAAGIRRSHQRGRKAMTRARKSQRAVDNRVRLAGDRYQSALRRKALASTKSVYGRAPREYANSIRREWKKWHTST